MNAKQRPVSAALAYVRFNKAKTVNAVAMTDAQMAIFKEGEELGYESAGFEAAFTAAIKALKTPEDRRILRAGFADAYDNATGARKAKAASSKGNTPGESRFDYLARTLAPAHTSRKAKSNSETRGRKEKAEKVVAKLSEKDVQSRLVAVLAYVAREMENHRGDDEVTEILASIARIANGSK